MGGGVAYIYISQYDTPYILCLHLSQHQHSAEMVEFRGSGSRGFGFRGSGLRVKGLGRLGFRVKGLGLGG